MTPVQTDLGDEMALQVCGERVVWGGTSEKSMGGRGKIGARSDP